MKNITYLLDQIYNLKREIDILFVEQGKIRRWTFDH